jgi:type IV pilus assembly protein PilA
MKFFQKLRKSRKGFTLIELIVVIAILAILAAILVPAMITYINKAQKQTMESDTRAVYSAACAAFSEVKTDPSKTLSADTVKAATETLLGSSYTGTDRSIAVTLEDDKGIATVSFTKKGKTCTYTAATGAFSGNY